MIRSFTSLLDVADLRRRERLVIEIESQLIRSDIGSLLRRVLADDLVQCPMEQMRDRVVALDRTAPRSVHRHANGLTHLRSTTVS